MAASLSPAPTDWHLHDEFIALLLHEHRVQHRLAFQRLWDYYRNDLDFQHDCDQRRYATAQESGLPERLRRQPRGDAASAREIVIENDIGWRVNAFVDFMFGKPLTIESLAEDRDQARLIERALEACFEANGGITFFQNMALLGSVYGYVDLLLRADRLHHPALREPFGGKSGRATATDHSTDQRGSAHGDGRRIPSKSIEAERVRASAALLQLETVEALRAIPVLDPNDYRQLLAYLLVYDRPTLAVQPTGFLQRLIRDDASHATQQASVEVVEIWSPRGVRIYEDGQLRLDRPLPLGRLPIVHIQNLPQPFYYEGLSDVEPLIPLQDELNTRLSDRANRVTMQAFKMYLGKGLDGFLERPVGPGQMWQTDNENATIQAFGGDAASPSEDAHINEIREALDKTSGVTPLAAGLIRDKVGNLTSENALRLVMMGLLAKTEKKRIAYGQGIQQIVELILATLHVAGVLKTRPEDRRIKLHWPSPIPIDTSQQLRDAQTKLSIGVPRDRVLAELGYSLDDTDIGG